MSEILTKIIPSNLAHKSPFAVLSHESIHDHVIAAGMMERDRKFAFLIISVQRLVMWHKHLTTITL